MPSVGRFLALPRPRAVNVLPLPSGVVPVLPLPSGVVPVLPLASGIVPVLPLNSSRSVLPSPMASASLGLTSSLKGHRGASALASAIGVHQTSVPVQFSLDCKPAADGVCSLFTCFDAKYFTYHLCSFSLASCCSYFILAWFISIWMSGIVIVILEVADARGWHAIAANSACGRQSCMITAALCAFDSCLCFFTFCIFIISVESKGSDIDA